MRTVNSLVATGGPTGAATDETIVVATTNQEIARTGLFLEVTLQTEGLITGLQHFVVHRTVGRVTDHAAFAGRFMFEDKGTALSLMAFETGVIGPGQLHAPPIVASPECAE